MSPKLTTAAAECKAPPAADGKRGSRTPICWGAGWSSVREGNVVPGLGFRGDAAYGGCTRPSRSAVPGWRLTPRPASAALEKGDMGMRKVAVQFGVATGTVQRIAQGLTAPN